MKLKSADCRARHFYNSFISTICIALCPVLLLAGVLISDYNTRQTGFSDAAPAFYYEYDGDFTISLLGQEVIISEEAISQAESAAKAAADFMPPQVRIFCGISDVIDSLLHFVSSLFL